MQHCAVDQADSKGKHVIFRLAVLHASVSGGIVADHASDPTDVMTPGIWCNSHGPFRQVLVQLCQQDARLDCDGLPLRVEPYDPLEARGV
jgi:hypothetical protein